MSSELDRVLRDARQTLPLPEEDLTQRARRRSVGTVRRARPRTRALVLLGATLVVALALGVTAGSLHAPSGTAPATRIAPYRNLAWRRSTRRPAMKLAIPSQTEAIM